jgi:hypothetical protein
LGEGRRHETAYREVIGSMLEEADRVTRLEQGRRAEISAATTIRRPLQVGSGFDGINFVGRQPQIKVRRLQ